MKEWLFLQIKITGLAPEGAISRFRRAEIPVYNAQKTDKKTVKLCVERKYRKKVFTILQDSCYNITEVKNYGLLAALRLVKRKMGLLIGCILFAVLCSLADYPVLKIDVVGSGAYYQREVLALLSESGVSVGKRFDGKTSPELTAKILTLENVSFCSIQKNGNTLRVEVQIASPGQYPVGGEALRAGADGRVYSLTVLRGKALVAVGDEVAAGDALVTGESEGGVVMASAKLLCGMDEVITATSEEEAFAAALLTMESDEAAREIVSREITPESDGFRVKMEYLLTISLNM